MGRAARPKKPADIFAVQEDITRSIVASTLIKIAYGYEQATRHRRPPASTPPLPADAPR